MNDNKNNDIKFLIDTSKELIEVFDGWDWKIDGVTIRCNDAGQLANEIIVIMPKLKKIIEKIEMDKIKEGGFRLNNINVY